MKNVKSPSKQRFFAVAAILLALFTLALPSCTSPHETCSAYQSIELEPCAQP